jgi:hypothetical protein
MRGRALISSQLPRLPVGPWALPNGQLWRHPLVRRAGLCIAVCLGISTQAFFQPQLYEAFSPSYFWTTWFEYFIECLLMGVPITVALTLSMKWVEHRGRFVAVVVVAAALFVGAFAGALLLIPFYDLDWNSVTQQRFWLDLSFWMVLGGGVATIDAFQRSAIDAATRLHGAQIDQAALSRQRLEARLQVMRAQIEPHFLFNTLANAKRLGRTDVRQGVAMLDDLIRYLEAALPRLREENATLGQEAELVSAYLAVINVRMGARLSFAVRIPDHLRDLAFPPMMLLTLTENAIKHGLNPAAEGGDVLIRADTMADCLEVSVRDTGVGFGAAATGGTGIGLANTRARLDALFGPRATLDFAPNEPHGVIARIVIPLAALPTRGDAGAGQPVGRSAMRVEGTAT